MNFLWDFHETAIGSVRNSAQIILLDLLRCHKFLKKLVNACHTVRVSMIILFMVINFKEKVILSGISIRLDK